MATSNIEERHMKEEHPPLRYIVWTEIFPWLLLFRTFRLALRLPILLCAVLSVVLLPLGWHGAEFLFVGNSRPEDVLFAHAVDQHGSWIAGGQIGYPSVGWPPSSQGAWDALTVFSDVFVEIATPFVELFQADASVAKSAYFLAGGLWSLLVWGWSAAVISRLVGVELATGRRVSIVSAAKHAAKNYVTYVTAPLYPQAGVFLVILPLVILGLLMRTDLGVLIGGIVAPLVVLLGICLAVLMLGLLCGWPLMWPVVSLEDQGDSFEALSRSYSFALQRPVHYLFYLAIASALCGLGVLFVNTFVEAALALAQWGLSWGAGLNRSAEIHSLSSGTEPGVFRGGVWLVEFWSSALRIVGHAFRYSFFWSAMTGIYLLLRRDVDETEFDDVYLGDLERPMIPSSQAE